MSAKIAIVEDNAKIRRQLVELVRSAPGFDCPYVFDCAETALKQLPLLRPDVILMDIGLPKMSGVDCTALLHQALPETPILIVTVFNDSNRIFKALQAGASGYLLKEVDDGELIQAITDAMQGDAPMSGAIARKVIEFFRRSTVSIAEDTRLSSREEEMLTWLARGYTNKEIAEHLDISFHTVRAHLRRIYKKLHVRGRMEAVAKHKSGQFS